MAKVDSLKEEIGWLKVSCAIVLASDISLIAWLAQNYEDQSAFLLVVGLFCVIIMAGGVVWMNWTAYKRIDELGGL